MANPEYSFYDDMDEQRIAEAINELNQRLENLKTNDEQDYEEDENREPLWPSLIPKTED